MICAGKTVAEIVSAGTSWPKRIAYLLPKNIVELGTGQGASAARIMGCLPPDAILTTVNYVDGEHHGEQLVPWYYDPRLTRVGADTLDRATLDLVPDCVDLLFIDTTHEAWHAAAELGLWQDKLQDGAVVVVDDLDQCDMADFWDSLPYEKSLYDDYLGQGVFRYDAGRRYEAEFDMPDRSTYGGDALKRR